MTTLKAASPPRASNEGVQQANLGLPESECKTKQKIPSQVAGLPGTRVRQHLKRLPNQI